jgi:fatty acid kinase
MVTKTVFGVRDNVNLVCDGQLFKRLVGAALSWLEQNQERVNRSNVFPVPDGDTGTNMVFTMRRAYQGIAQSEDTNVGRIAHEVAQGAMMGSRGNSGVILSQLWVGFAGVLDGYESFDGPLFAQACESAVEMAYKAVQAPVEGTILTVARESTEAVVRRVAHEPDLVGLLKIMVYAARASLRRTPELLAVLKHAGVVDSGGQGLVFVLEGMLLSLCGKHFALDEQMLVTRHTWRDALEPEDEQGYGYDVQFLMRGQGMDVQAVRRDIENMGWSTLVVGDERVIKVHVHVHNPGDPIGYAIRQGAELDDVVVENMQRQYETYVEERSVRESEIAPENVAVIAVAQGEGMQRLFKRDLQAADVLAGGQTANPSTEDFLTAMECLPNKRIILLPNNKNVTLAARQAARLAKGKDVRVIPTRTVPQGIMAMIQYANMPDAQDMDALAEAMEETSRTVLSGEVTRATRSVEMNGLHVIEGEYIGLLDDKLVAAAEDILPVMRDLLSAANASKHELVTLYYGSDVDEARADALIEALAHDYPRQEFQRVNGGQALYPYIISIE